MMNHSLYDVMLGALIQACEDVDGKFNHVQKDRTDGVPHSVSDRWKQIQIISDHLHEPPVG